MQKLKKTLTSTLLLSALTSGFTLSLASAQLANTADLSTAIKSCAQIAEDPARLDCFDAISRQLPEDSAQTYSKPEPELESKQAETQSSSSPTEITNAVGGSEFSRDKESGPEVYTAKVSRCQQGADGRWFFIFSNQQVWKQVKNNSRRFRNCSFDVTISKDLFGYVMQRQDNERKIRVKRIK